MINYMDKIVVIKEVIKLFEFIVVLVGVITLGAVYETAYVVTCVQVASEGIDFTEVAELKNFQIVATIVMFLETSAITAYLFMKAKGWIS